MAEEAKKIVMKEPPKSVLYFCRLENMHFSTKTLAAFNKLADDTSPYDKAMAVMEVKGLLKVMYDAYSKVSKLPLKTFENKSEALDWLMSR